MYGFSDHLKPMPLTGLRALLQGSSRYSIRMSSAGSIEQTFVQLEDDIQRLTLPLPTGPKHVHCYVAHGTLFDTGLGLGETPWESVGVERIAITHFHPDHVGGAEVAARTTGAPVFQGGLDYAQCERVWGSDDWPERMAAWFVRHGVPANVADDLIVQGHAFAPFIRYAIDPDLLDSVQSLANSTASGKAAAVAWLEKLRSQANWAAELRGRAAENGTARSCWRTA